MTEFTIGTTWPNIEEAKRAVEEYIVSRGESWKYHKPICDAGSGSAKIVRNVTFEFDSISQAQGLQNLSFLHHIPVLV